MRRSLLAAVVAFATEVAASSLVVQFLAQFPDLSQQQLSATLDVPTLRANTMPITDLANDKVTRANVLRLCSESVVDVPARLAVLKSFIVTTVPELNGNLTVQLAQARDLFAAWTSDNLGTLLQTWTPDEVDYRGLLLVLNLATVLDFNSGHRHATLKMHQFSILDPIEQTARKGYVPKPPPSAAPSGVPTSETEAPTSETEAPTSETEAPTAAVSTQSPVASGTTTASPALVPVTAAPTMKPTKKPTKKKKKSGRVLQSTTASYDLRMQGAVGPVLNQGTCGDCWVFAATAVVEGALVKQLGFPLVELSEQQIVSCASALGVCQGGWPSAVYDYLAEASQVSSSTAPYTEISFSKVLQLPDVTCDELPAAVNTSGIAVVDGYSNLTSEADIMNALQTQGPVSILISAQSACFNSYWEGVLLASECACYSGSLDHAVVIVGWGTDANTSVPYWIVRNSWGLDVGLHGTGYWLLERDMVFPGMCGLLIDAQSANVALTSDCASNPSAAFCTQAQVPALYATWNYNNNTMASCPYVSLAGSSTDNNPPCVLGNGSTSAAAMPAVHVLVTVAAAAAMTFAATVASW